MFVDLTLIPVICLRGRQAFQSVLSFSSKEIIALTCSWCKISVHNKTACFNDTKMNEPCSLGKIKNNVCPSFLPPRPTAPSSETIVIIYPRDQCCRVEIDR